MPNIAAVLKAEIRRLARREVNAQTAAAKKASSQYRRDIAELKRTVTALQRRVAFLEKQETRRAGKPQDSSSANGLRFSPEWVKAHRERLGVSAADYGALVGVSPLTIYNWEHGRTRPREKQLASLAAVRKMGKREAIRRLEML